MLKYILFFVLAVLLVCNYLSKKILTFVIGHEPEEKQIIVCKMILYVITVIAVICFMIMA